jgi:predicted MPP superfamily phosphohydrolase
VFGIVLLTVITVMQIYVFQRAATVPFVKRHISKKLLIVTGIVLWAVFFLGRFIGHGSTGTLMTLEFLGMNWMAVVFLVTVSLLMVDIITVFGLVLPRLAPFLRGCALAAGAVLSVIALVQGLRPPVIQNYDVNLSGLPPGMDGTVIVAMSDLHVGTLIGRQWLEARVSQVAAQQPDLVVLLGDIFEGHDQPEEELIAVLRRLSAPLGVWAVLGNHEFHGRNNTGASLMNYDGIRVLNNSWAEVRPSLVLAGVDDLTANHRSGQGGDPISRALAGRPPGTTVLLSHTPWYADRIAADGVGLMLSGHTHGGQIWPFGYLAQRIYPLIGGRYEVDGMTVIVCRGTGTWGPRMRLWRPGEILRVTLHTEGKQSSFFIKS